MNEIIRSPHNKRILETARLLTQRRRREETGKFIVEGFRNLEQVIRSTSPRYQITEVYVSERVIDRPEVSGLLSGLVVFVVDDILMGKISDVQSSQGVVAVVQCRNIPLRVDEQKGLYLLLDSVSDPGNMGTLIRSAVAAGFDAVLIYGTSVDVYNPKTVRATMGTFAGIPILPVDDEFLGVLKSLRYDIIAAHMEGSDNIFRATFGERTVLAVGSEAHGISGSIRSVAGRSVFIPMTPDCESLNAAVAGSICMFQIAHNLGRI